MRECQLFGDASFPHSASLHAGYTLRRDLFVPLPAGVLLVKGIA